MVGFNRVEDASIHFFAVGRPEAVGLSVSPWVAWNPVPGVSMILILCRVDSIKVAVPSRLTPELRSDGTR